jgi:DNA repair protein RAD7
VLQKNDLSQIAYFCPNLTRLELGMCGRMTDEILELIGDRLTNLQSLRLHGPFLCTGSAFSKMFMSLGGSLSSLTLSHASKLSNESFKSLVLHCDSISELNINESRQIDGDGVKLIEGLKRLIKLSLDNIGQVDSIVLETLLTKIGSNLQLLSLNGYILLILSHQNITDNVHSVISNECNRSLVSLSLESCNQLSTESLPSLIRSLKDLKHLNLSRNTEIDDKVVYAAIETHWNTLESFELNGLQLLTNEVLQLLAKCGRLVNLDISWCRDVNDLVVEQVLLNCRFLKDVRVLNDDRSKCLGVIC